MLSPSRWKPGQVPLRQMLIDDVKIGSSHTMPLMRRTLPNEQRWLGQFTNPWRALLIDSRSFAGILGQPSATVPHCRWARPPTSQHQSCKLSWLDWFNQPYLLEHFAAPHECLPSFTMKDTPSFPHYLSLLLVTDLVQLCTKSATSNMERRE